MRISDWSSDVCSSDLAHFDRTRELAGGVAVAREDGDAVAILVRRGPFHRFGESSRADDLEHRPDNLLLIGPHRRGDMVEQRRAPEIALLIPLTAASAAVAHPLAAFIHAHLALILDARLV